MAISFDNTLGLHQQALAFRSQRAEVIAGNLANVDTPGYTAKDLDFSKALKQAREQFTPLRDNPLRIQQPGDQTTPEVVERTETQPAADGNTVELGREQAAWAENRAQWEASFTFLNQKFKGLEQAING